VHGLDFAHNTIVNYHTTMRFWGDRDEQISEVDVHDNVFVQDDMPSAWRLIEMKDPTWQDPAPGLPRVAFSANRYFSRPLQANRWFRDFTGDMGFDGWASVRQEPSAAMLDASGLLPTPCVADYAASCGDGPSPAAFFDAARERRFGAWTDEYASATVLAYLQSWVVTAFANAGSE
jgi:hypothetical protein